MAANDIGLGFIGLSSAASWAGRAHVPALKVVPGYEIRALRTSRSETAAQAAQTYGVPFFSHDPAQLVERPEVDLVVVAVSVPYHLELVEAALDAGKMVYREWPLGNGRGEAEQMAVLAARQGRPGLRRTAGPCLASHPLYPRPRRLRPDRRRDLDDLRRLGRSLGDGRAAAGLRARPQERRLDADRASSAMRSTASAGASASSRSSRPTLATRYPLVKRTDTGEEVPKTIDDQIALTGTLQNGAVAAVHYRSGASQAASFFWEVNGSKGDLVITGDSGRLQYGDLRIRGTSEMGELEEWPIPDSYRLVSGCSPSDMSTRWRTPMR